MAKLEMTRGWSGLRIKTFQSDGYVCQLCARKFFSYQLNAHHIIPRQLGGEDERWNLTTLCVICHDGLHAKEALFPKNANGELPRIPNYIDTAADDFYAERQLPYDRNGVYRYYVNDAVLDSLASTPIWNNPWIPN